MRMHEDLNLSKTPQSVRCLEAKEITMKLIVLTFTLLLSTECRLEKKVKYKIYPVTIYPMLEASFLDRLDSYESPEYASYEKEVAMPIDKFFVGLPAFLGFLKVLFFVNGRCSSATLCTTTFTSTSTTTTSSTATITSTSTSKSVPLTTSTSITSTTTTTSTTPVATTTRVDTQTTSSTQSVVVTSSSTSVISQTATATTTVTSTRVTVTISTSVLITTTTASSPVGRFGIFDYEYDDFTFINDYSLSETSSKSITPFSSINEDSDLMDRIDQQDWLNENEEFNFGEIESSNIAEDYREIKSEY